MTLTAPRTAGAHFANFAETYCHHTKGRWAGQSLTFEPWQREVFDEILALDERGRRVYQFVLLGLPRKNAKTTKAAALGLYLAGPDGEAGPEVIMAAGSRDQAAMVFDQARAFVETNPELEDWFEPQRFLIRCPSTNGFIRRVAADGRLQHGWNPHGIVIDELHAFDTPRQEELYTAMTTATGAREEPLTVAITTAGFHKDTVLGRLYDRAMNLPGVERRGGLTIARDRDTGFLMLWYGAPVEADIDDPAVWADANPASWITKEYLRRQLNSPEMDEGSFRRLHLNQWTKARDAWLPVGCWAGLRSDAEIEDGTEICVGVDVGLKHDSTAVVIAHRLSDGRVALRAHVWSPVHDAPYHTYAPGGRVDLGVIEDHIKGLAQRYFVREVVFDPRYFERSAQHLSESGLWVAPLEQQSARMADALQGFYVAAREGRITHNGDPVLSSHVEATAAEMTERGWKIKKLKSSMRIDALVAAVMAHSRAARDEAAGYVVADA